VFASLVYLPHAFTSLLVQDPAGALEKGLEILLYNTVAVVAGLLVDRSAASASGRKGWRPGWGTPSRSSGGSRRS